MANVTTSAETNLIKAAQMSKAREVDFTQRFTHNSLQKLIEALGVTRKIPMMEGTTMYLYATSGTLQSGAVAEGEIIPLSQYETTKVAVGEITLNKWRKAVSAEAIKKSGYQAAVRDTDNALLKDVQKSIRTDFFGLLNNTIPGNTYASGSGLQSAFADAWGDIQTLFEDDTAEAVYFVNPKDIADYLKSATITTQTAFGMQYIEDFLGLGTVIVTSQVTQGTFIATAKENLVMYYLTVNGDVAEAFGLTADELGYIGINSNYRKNERAQVETLVMCGIQFFVEYAAGVVVGYIGTATKVTSAETITGTSGDAKLFKTAHPQIISVEELKDGSTAITAYTIERDGVRLASTPSGTVTIKYTYIA